MAAPEFVPVPPLRTVRAYESPPRRPDMWMPNRPGDLESGQPRGERYGVPGPDQGYALKIAADVFVPQLQLGQLSADDAVAGCLGVCLKRAALFGRAPVAHDWRVTVAGLVIVRQRPGTAKGVIFMTLEDEAAICNVIVWPHVFERYRPIVMGARLILVKGKLQREGIVTHIVADKLYDISPLLDTLTAREEPMPLETARADHVKRPDRPDARDPENKRRPHLLYPSRDFH